MNNVRKWRRYFEGFYIAIAFYIDTERYVPIPSNTAIVFYIDLAFYIAIAGFSISVRAGGGRRANPEIVFRACVRIRVRRVRASGGEGGACGVQTLGLYM